MTKRLLCGVLCVGAALMAACAENEAEEKAEDGPPKISFLTPYGPPKNPFSPAVQVGDMLYLAGQIGTDSSGALVTGGIEAETHQTLKNIADVLAKTGSSMDRVVKCTAFLLDMKEWPAMNAIYRTYFPTNFPARSALGATGLALNSRVEIECIAVVAR